MIQCIRVLTGLSPRTRGSRSERQRNRILRGSIPAHAGEPRTTLTNRVMTEVYPRARGGAFAMVLFDPVGRGLSPRTRGSHHIRGGHHGLSRSIPAHAGEPRACASSWKLPWVYPRARGGATVMQRPYHSENGLSPRTRGSRSERQRNRILRGSIPAHAGEPISGRVLTALAAVYPRARGGAPRCVFVDRHDDGLSPRTRGSRSLRWRRAVSPGSIPAHAGEPR